MRRVTIEPTYEGWHAAARRLLAAGIPPDAVAWREGTPAAEPPAPPAAEPAARVPRRFVELARGAAAHPDPERWALLYRVLWRLVHDNRALLDVDLDRDVHRLRRLDREAQRGAAAGPTPAAPPVPLDAAARGGVHLQRVGRRPAARAETRRDAPAVPSLLPDEPAPLRAVPEPARTAAAYVPPTDDLDALARAAAGCRGCDLYRDATQTVFGQGPRDARLVLVGEQPGDQEDRQGAPFVGPAGQVLDRALAEVGLDRARVYVTNAVKHFKFVARGKRRIHEKPRAAEVVACRPWFEAELRALNPSLVVCLGATAASALFGSQFRLLQQRGRILDAPAGVRALATIHPSAVLRGQDEEDQARLYAMLVEDLRLAAAALPGAAPPG